MCACVVVVCSDCNQFTASMISQHNFLTGVVDKLASDAVSKLSLVCAIILLISECCYIVSDV